MCGVMRKGIDAVIRNLLLLCQVVPVSITGLP